MLFAVTGDVPEFSTESSAGKTSLSEIVDTPMQCSNSDTASDGCSSRMVKKISGGGTEPGSRNFFQLISARGMAAECLSRSPTELRAMSCMGLGERFLEEFVFTDRQFCQTGVRSGAGLRGAVA